MILGKQNAPPFKKAVQNTVLIVVLIGILTQFQGSDLKNTLLTMAMTFVFVLPSLWLSFRFTHRLLTKKSSPTDS